MTIYEIAQEAGVSSSTVSRVINHRTGVKPEVRARVQALLDKYHFSPNSAAKGLSEGSSKLIAITVEDIRNIQDAMIAYIIQRALAQIEYDVLIVNAGRNEQEKAQAIRSLSARRLEGLVIIGSNFENSAVSAAIRQALSDIPIVCVNCVFSMPNTHSLLIDFEDGVSESVRYLVAHGKTNIAFISASSSPSSKKKEAGYLRGMKEMCPGVEPLIIALAATRQRDGSSRATRELLARNPDLQAILYSNDYIALAGLAELQRLHKAVPEDIAIMGINKTPYVHLCNPRMTTLDTKMEELGSMCANSLINLINGNPTPRKMMIFTEVSEGGSV